ncbi:flagellar assembly protein FliH [Metasolibacillus meyeri]|uniref:flagellar assembly protein FliH n=1 Tax=Metasolibacillus meyeri TaxID=1071052 RepID=UPI003082F36A
MTSLSRIIRSIQAQSTEAEQGVKIEIKDFFQPTSFQGDHQTEDFENLTLENIHAEREIYLAEARRQIEFERRQLEQYRDEQLQAIEQLKQIWQEEKLVLEQQAHEEGFAAGYEEGIQKANAAMEQSLAMTNETMMQAQQNAQKYIDDQEFVVLELALTAAERIIGVSLERDDELFTAIVKRGLKEAREMKEIKIYVAPIYYELITKNRDELAEMFPPDVPLLIFVNEDLENTESYIETNHGRIVISIDEQLHELRLKLNEILTSKD